VKKLSREGLRRAEAFIRGNGRKLEKSLFDFYFSGGNKAGVIQALKSFQNEDGGFGRGLEPDFRMPFSSPMATSIGLRIIAGVNADREAEEEIKRAVQYLENSYSPNRNGWFAVNPAVNDFPHTPWWHFVEGEKMTVIDHFWGNPSAELAGYLFRYREFVQSLDVQGLIAKAVDNLKAREKFESEHELYCYVRFYRELTPEVREDIRERLAEGIARLVEYRPEKWREYTPMPLDFVPSPAHGRFGLEKARIDENLDFLVDLLEEGGYISPPWGDSFYAGEFRAAVPEWEGVLTLEALKKLKDYNRLEK